VLSKAKRDGGLSHVLDSDVSKPQRVTDRSITQTSEFRRHSVVVELYHNTVELGQYRFWQLTRHAAIKAGDGQLY